MFQYYSVLHHELINIIRKFFSHSHDTTKVKDYQTSVNFTANTHYGIGNPMTFCQFLATSPELAYNSIVCQATYSLKLAPAVFENLSDWKMTFNNQENIMKDATSENHSTTRFIFNKKIVYLNLNRYILRILRENKLEQSMKYFCFISPWNQQIYFSTDFFTKCIHKYLLTVLSF